MNKKIFLFAAALVCGAMTANATDFVVNNINYDFINDSTEVCVGNNKAYAGNPNVVILDSVTYEGVKYRVDNVSSMAFYGNQIIEMLDVAVGAISASAFRDCSKLSSVTMREGVTRIYWSAFKSDTLLTTVHIPASVSYIDWDNPFESCSQITAFTVAEGNTAFCAIDGVLYNQDTTQLLAYPLAKIPFSGFRESVTMLANGSFASYQGLDTLTLPLRITDTDGAFFRSSVKTLIVECPLVVNAFQNCELLETIILGKNVTDIGQLTFNNCTALRNITCKGDSVPFLQYPNTSSWPCFRNVDLSLITLTVPCGKTAKYQADTDKWADFTTITEDFFYDLTVESANEAQGTVAVTTAPDCSTDAVIAATPAADCLFDKWSDGNTDNPRTLTVTSDTTLTAQFRRDATALQQVELVNIIFVENGWVRCEREFRIYDVTGRDVTKQNGKLNGIYIVKTDDNVTKVVVR